MVSRIIGLAAPVADVVAAGGAMRHLPRRNCGSAGSACVICGRPAIGSMMRTSCGGREMRPKLLIARREIGDADGRAVLAADHRVETIAVLRTYSDLVSLACRARRRRSPFPRRPKAGARTPDRRRSAGSTTTPAARACRASAAVRPLPMTARSRPPSAMVPPLSARCTQPGAHVVRARRRNIRRPAMRRPTEMPMPPNSGSMANTSSSVTSSPRKTGRRPAKGGRFINVAQRRSLVEAACA